MACEEIISMFNKLYLNSTKYYKLNDHANGKQIKDYQDLERLDNDGECRYLRKHAY